MSEPNPDMPDHAKVSQPCQVPVGTTEYGQAPVRLPRSLSLGQCLAIHSAIAVPVCLLGVWAIDVVGMEGIIAQGARHMVDTGEWFVPKLYGDTYAFKPALAYWLAAISEGLFGHLTAWSLRLPTAMCGIALGAVVCAVMGRLVTPTCGLWCALSTTLAPLFIEQVRAATFDMPLALGTGVAMLVACRSLALGRSKWHWWLFGYLGLAFAFLAKGVPAVVLYAPGLVVASVVLRRVKYLFGWQHLLGVAAFALIVFAYLYGCYRDEGFAAFKDHTGELLGRSGQWRLGSLAWMLLTPAQTLVFFLPFSVLLVLAPLHKPRASSTIVAQRIQRAAWTFLLVGLAVFSVAGDYESRYFLPLITPVALLSGLAAETLAAAHRMPATRDTDGRQCRMPQRAELGRRLPIILVVAGVIYWAVYAGIVQPRRCTKQSERIIAEAFNPHLPQGATVYVIERDSQSSLAFYLDRPIRTWDTAEPPPAESFFLIVVGGEHDIDALGFDVAFKPIVSKVSPRKQTYHLGVARQVRADDSSRG